MRQEADEDELWRPAPGAGEHPAGVGDRHLPSVHLSSPPQGQQSDSFALSFRTESVVFSLLPVNPSPAGGCEVRGKVQVKKERGEQEEEDKHRKWCVEVFSPREERVPVVSVC